MTRLTDHSVRVAYDDRVRRSTMRGRDTQVQDLIQGQRVIVRLAGAVLGGRLEALPSSDSQTLAGYVRLDTGQLMIAYRREVEAVIELGGPHQ